ncbi:MAG: phosphoribosyltransferase [Chloroflexi bacterium]|nr:phosphoribosyltransferase [Chloroflexota bacterium]
MLFTDRRDAGQRLAARLAHYRNGRALVLAIPRGGVEIGAPIARALSLPLDVVVVRKLPIPWNPEMGFGAVTVDGAAIMDQKLVYELGLAPVHIEVIAAKVRQEIERRSRTYRGDRPPPELKGKTVIIVDDGLATGYTMLAAIKSARNQEAGRIVAAVPVASAHSASRVEAEADEFIALAVAETQSFAVAEYYRYWIDLSDVEVVALLQPQPQGDRSPSSHNA